MKIIKYFFQSIVIFILFFIFKILGYKNSSNMSAILFGLFGPLIRSKKIIMNNINIAFPNSKKNFSNEIIKNMWKYYGRILSDYMFIKSFRKKKLDKYIEIEGKEILEKIKEEKKPVIFISGHFNNFELLAMEIAKTGIELAVVYRPLNNIFLNKIMEQIRTNYICKNQVPKGIKGVKKLVEFVKNGKSIALMIDQRVSQGIKSKLFNRYAYTTTIPGQFVKKYSLPIVPVYIERIRQHNFKIYFETPIVFDQKESIEKITSDLNLWLEKKIKKNPAQWIWSHNRWK